MKVKIGFKKNATWIKGMQMALFACLLVLPLAMHGQTKVYTLKECIDIGLKYQTDIKIAEVNQKIATEQSKQVRGALLPSFKLDYTWLHYDKPVRISTTEFIGDIPPNPLFDPSKIPPITVYEVQNHLLKINAFQPLTLLYQLLNAFQISRTNVVIKDLKVQLERRRVVLNIKTAYYSLLLAKSLVKTVKETLSTLREHVKNAKIFYINGVIAKNDYLRATVGEAEAEERLIVTRHQVGMAQANLNYQMGLPVNDPIEIHEIGGYKPMSLTFNQCYDTALKNRLEIMEVKNQIKMAQMGRNIKFADLLPTLNFFAYYQYMKGQSFMMPENSFAFGLALSFNIWDWGTNFYKYKEASSQIDLARTYFKKLTEGISLQVKNNMLKVLEDLQSIDLAKKTIEQADESLRVELKRYNVQASTTTDVLNAQTSQGYAKAKYFIALYKYKSNLAIMYDSMGL